jgi:hypothetical protein
MLVFTSDTIHCWRETQCVSCVFSSTERTEIDDTVKLVRHCHRAAAVQITEREITTNHLELQPKLYSSIPASSERLVPCARILHVGINLHLEKVQSSGQDMSIGRAVSYQPSTLSPSPWVSVNNCIRHRPRAIIIYHHCAIHKHLPQWQITYRMLCESIRKLNWLELWREIHLEDT